MFEWFLAVACSSHGYSHVQDDRSVVHLQAAVQHDSCLYHVVLTLCTILVHCRLYWCSLTYVQYAVRTVYIVILLLYSIYYITVMHCAGHCTIPCTVLYCIILVFFVLYRSMPYWTVCTVLKGRGVTLEAPSAKLSSEEIYHALCQ